MRRILAVCVPIVLEVLLATSAPPAAHAGSAAASPPPSGGGTTDPLYDWERVPDPRDHYNRNWVKALTFKSTRTLDQTTRWLQWALERYGDGRGQVTTHDISDVRFRQCTMEWTERQVMHGVTTVSKYSVPLSDVDLRRKTIQGSGANVRFSLTNDTARILRRYYEHGREKGSKDERDNDIFIFVRDEEQMADRIAWALMHASRLCGAPVKTEYGSSR
jgi:hypothetical protein